jgi:hypothetical protein
VVKTATMMAMLGLNGEKLVGFPLDKGGGGGGDGGGGGGGGEEEEFIAPLTTSSAAIQQGVTKRETAMRTTTETSLKGFEQNTPIFDDAAVDVVEDNR